MPYIPGGVSTTQGLLDAGGGVGDNPLQPLTPLADLGDNPLQPLTPLADLGDDALAPFTAGASLLIPFLSGLFGGNSNTNINNNSSNLSSNPIQENVQSVGGNPGNTPGQFGTPILDVSPTNIQEGADASAKASASGGFGLFGGGSSNANANANANELQSNPTQANQQVVQISASNPFDVFTGAAQTPTVNYPSASVPPLSPLTYTNLPGYQAPNIASNPAAVQVPIAGGGGGGNAVPAALLVGGGANGAQPQAANGAIPGSTDTGGAGNAPASSIPQQLGGSSGGMLQGSIAQNAFANGAPTSLQAPPLSAAPGPVQAAMAPGSNTPLIASNQGLVPPPPPVTPTMIATGQTDADGNMLYRQAPQRGAPPAPMPLKMPNTKIEAPRADYSSLPFNMKKEDIDKAVKQDLETTLDQGGITEMAKELGHADTEIGDLKRQIAQKREALNQLPTRAAIAQYAARIPVTQYNTMPFFGVSKGIAALAQRREMMRNYAAVLAPRSQEREEGEKDLADLKDSLKQAEADRTALLKERDDTIDKAQTQVMKKWTEQMQYHGKIDSADINSAARAAIAEAKGQLTATMDMIRAQHMQNQDTNNNNRTNIYGQGVDDRNVYMKGMLAAQQAGVPTKQLQALGTYMMGAQNMTPADMQALGISPTQIQAIIGSMRGAPQGAAPATPSSGSEKQHYYAALRDAGKSPEEAKKMTETKFK